MKTALLLFILFIPSFSLAEEIPLPAVVICEMYGLLHKITGEMRDKNIPPKQAVVEVTKLIKKDTFTSHNIINNVYVKHKDKKPEWIEGYFFGMCVSELSTRTPQPAPNTKGTNPKLLM